MKFTVEIFSPAGERLHHVPGLDRHAARRVVTLGRRKLDAAYIHRDDTVLSFKPYRRDPFSKERAKYWSAGPARLSNTQIEAAAKRFEDDGEHDNAATIRSMKR